MPVWVLRAFCQAIVEAALIAVYGLAKLLWSPLRSMRLIAALPLNLRAIWRLIGELRGPGLVVTTPPPPCDSPTLRTSIVGLGNFTTRIAEGAALSPALVALHFERVQAHLEPLAATQQAILRLNALLTTAATFYFAPQARLHSMPTWGAAFNVFWHGFLISFSWTLLVRVAAPLTVRLGLRWLDREASSSPRPA